MNKLKKDIRLIQFEPGEFKPLFVKAPDIDRVIIGLSPKTMANWRSEKRGPPYYITGRAIYYKLKDLEDYFGGNPIQTTNF